MENQHRLIIGYRELAEADIALMNKIKAHGIAAQALHEEVIAHVSAQFKAAQPSYASEMPVDSEDGPFAEMPCLDTPAQIEAKSAEMSRLAQAEFRWLAMAKTSMQIGTMELTRAVAQPTTF